MAESSSVTHGRRRPGKIVIGFLALLIVLVGAFLTANALSPVWTLRAVVRAGGVWQRHWPLRKGYYAPDRAIDFLYLAGLAKPVEVEVWPGGVFELDARDLIARSLLETGLWEPSVTRAAAEVLKEGQVMIDVGAHIGYYSIFASPRVGPSGKVIAVEPNPETLPWLYKNLKLSNAANVVVAEVANTDRETTVQFFQASRWNSGMSSLSKANAIRSPGHVVTATTVRGRPLDALVRELGLRRVDLIKIDVEGAEVQVLRGSKETLATFRPVLLVEMDDEQLVNMGTSIQELRAVLLDSGYVLDRQLDGINFEWIPGPGLKGAAPSRIPKAPARSAIAAG